MADNTELYANVVDAGETVAEAAEAAVNFTAETAKATVRVTKVATRSLWRGLRDGWSNARADRVANTAK